MDNIEITHDWQDAGAERAEFRATTAYLTIKIAGQSLTANEDIWSRTLKGSTLVSLYPLANWLLSSWWRLLWEPLPARGVSPPIDWRMSHEIGAVGHGVIWPRIAIAAEGETVRVWATAFDPGERQAVRYVNGLERPAVLDQEAFRRSIEGLVRASLERLSALGHPDTGLKQLWLAVQEEMNDASAVTYRRLEAKLGFDPDEGPDRLMEEALRMHDNLGASTLDELIPVYANASPDDPLSPIARFAATGGVKGTPHLVLSNPAARHTHCPPWRRAVDDAQRARMQVGPISGQVSTTVLCDTLGIQATDYESRMPEGREKVAVAVPAQGLELNFFPRKRHPHARRFELARFLADSIFAPALHGGWLASTDLATSRQQYQRAFAAEFLCPAVELEGFLGRDYSEPALEDASDHFGVSTATVTTVLANSGLIPRSDVYEGSHFPYAVA